MFKLEMHSHTFSGSSDKVLPVEVAVEEAQKNDINGIMITNHYGTLSIENMPGSTISEKLSNWFDIIVKAKHIGERVGIKVYAGIEYTTEKYQHFSIVGFDGSSFPDIQKDYAYLRKYADGNGYFLIQNHPVRSSNPIDVIEYDRGIGYELYNLHYLSRLWSDSIRVRRATEHLNPMYTIGTDCHCKEDVGKSYMLFNDMQKNEIELAEALRNNMGTPKVFFKRLREGLTDMELNILADIGDFMVEYNVPPTIDDVYRRNLNYIPGDVFSGVQSLKRHGLIYGYGVHNDLLVAANVGYNY